MANDMAWSSSTTQISDRYSETEEYWMSFIKLVRAKVKKINTSWCQMLIPVICIKMARNKDHCLRQLCFPSNKDNWVLIFLVCWVFDLSYFLIYTLLELEIGENLISILNNYIVLFNNTTEKNYLDEIFTTFISIVNLL